MPRYFKVRNLGLQPGLGCRNAGADRILMSGVEIIGAFDYLHYRFAKASIEATARVSILFGIFSWRRLPIA